jgi:hypothetical protein
LGRERRACVLSLLRARGRGAPGIFDTTGPLRHRARGCAGWRGLLARTARQQRRTAVRPLRTAAVAGRGAMRARVPLALACPLACASPPPPPQRVSRRGALAGAAGLCLGAPRGAATAAEAAARDAAALPPAEDRGLTPSGRLRACKARAPAHTHTRLQHAVRVRC